MDSIRNSFHKKWPGSIVLQIRILVCVVVAVVLVGVGGVLRVIGVVGGEEGY